MENDNAADFNLDGSDGKRHSLSEFNGKYLVLYFYPKDNTPGCTIEAKEFNKHLQELKSLNAAVVGVSKDDLKSHGKFVEKCDLKFLLLSDPNSEVIKAYGAYGDRGIFGVGTLRNTYLIKDGKVLKVFTKVKPNGHAEEVIDAIKSIK
ncbi:MAG: peroxiredoxin [Candidatus Marsarchaeota archaeon]|nr:peroxiredoxin [Candidatus Marsarchaeota archaeon]